MFNAHRINRLAISALVSAALILLLSAPGGASAAFSTIKMGEPKTFGDCTLRASVEVDQLGFWDDAARAAGVANCTERHAKTEFEVILKKNGAVWTTSGVATFTNSFGTGPTWRRSPTRYLNAPQCFDLQAVVKVTISGLGSNYVTSGSPKRECS